MEVDWNGLWIGKKKGRWEKEGRVEKEVIVEGEIKVMRKKSVYEKIICIKMMIRKENE